MSLRYGGKLVRNGGQPLGQGRFRGDAAQFRLQRTDYRFAHGDVAARGELAGKLMGARIAYLQILVRLQPS
jgi:hypothetical protein